MTSQVMRKQSKNTKRYSSSSRETREGPTERGKSDCFAIRENRDGKVYSLQRTCPAIRHGDDQDERALSQESGKYRRRAWSYAGFRGEARQIHQRDLAC